MSKRRTLIELSVLVWNDPAGPLPVRLTPILRAIEAEGKVGSSFGRRGAQGSIVRRGEALARFSEAAIVHVKIFEKFIRDTLGA
jgi:hypothetical protein